MNYTEEQKAAFKRQFAARDRRNHILAGVLVVLSIGFAYVTDAGNRSTWLGLNIVVGLLVFTTLVSVSLICLLRLIRCPACGSRHLIGRVERSPHCCPKCGLTLW